MWEIDAVARNYLDELATCDREETEGFGRFSVDRLSSPLLIARGVCASSPITLDRYNAGG